MKAVMMSMMLVRVLVGVFDDGDGAADATAATCGCCCRCSTASTLLLPLCYYSRGSLLLVFSVTMIRMVATSINMSIVTLCQGPDQSIFLHGDDEHDDNHHHRHHHEGHFTLARLLIVLSVKHGGHTVVPA